MSPFVPVAFADLGVYRFWPKFYHGRHCLAIKYRVWRLVVPVILLSRRLGSRCLCRKCRSKRRQRQEGIYHGAHRCGGGGGGLLVRGSGPLERNKIGIMYQAWK